MAIEMDKSDMLLCIFLMNPLFCSRMSFPCFTGIQSITELYHARTLMFVSSLHRWKRLLWMWELKNLTS